MSKKSDKDSDGGSMQRYTIEDVFRQGLKIEDHVRCDEVGEELIRRLSDSCDYMKTIMCVVIAMEMLKPDGFLIYIKGGRQEEKHKDAYFSKIDDSVVLFANDSVDDMYMALIDQLIYKMFSTVDLDSNEKKDVMDALDVMKETRRTYYEELTQVEIKMLEWLDIKLIDWIDKLSYDKDDYVTDLEHINEGVINLAGVCLMWERNLDRLDAASKILSPLVECIQNTILTKIENFIINNELIDKIKIPDYFKMKLNTIKLLSRENISYKKKFNILRDVRALELPARTKKTLDEFKTYINEFEHTDESVKEFEKERSIYEYSVLQRSDELDYINKKREGFSKNKKENEEVLMHLANVVEVIESEKQDLEESLKIIDEEVNLLKGAEV